MKKTNNKNKIIFVIVVLILFMIVSLLMIIKGYNYKQNNNISNVEINQLAEIINNLGSKYISIKTSEEKGYVKDIYLEFKYNLYENNESKENVYTNLIEHVVIFEKANIRLIDESRNIIIRINYNVDENSYYYTINNEKDYFKNQDSINSLKSNKEVPNTDLHVNSEELENIIDNNWSSSSVDIDGEMNRFNNYDEYFYNGIKIRNIMSKVYNVVFAENYEESVINGIKVGTSFEKIEDILGKPTLKNGNIIGYKNEDLYVFFSESEISIYRNETYETEEFSKLLSRFLDSEINLKTFMNELTYLWDDYSEYNYSSNYVYISYPNQGLQIQMNNYNDNVGIEIYQNFNITSEIKDYISTGKIIGKLDENLICQVENKRIIQREELLYQAKMNTYIDNNVENGLVDENLSDKYLYTYRYNSNNDVISVMFFSIDGNEPDLELKENVYCLVWKSDNEVIYSIKNEGIYYYNLSNKDKQELVIGNDEFYIKAYDKGILDFDEKTLEIRED